MRPGSAKKAYALVLALILLGSLCLLAVEAGHECTRCDCQVCQAIHTAVENLKALSLCAAGLALCAAGVCLFRLGAFGGTASLRRVTPVYLKVKLSN